MQPREALKTYIVYMNDEFEMTPMGLSHKPCTDGPRGAPMFWCAQEEIGLRAVVLEPWEVRYLRAEGNRLSLGPFRNPDSSEPLTKEEAWLILEWTSQLAKEASRRTAADDVSGLDMRIFEDRSQTAADNISGFDVRLLFKGGQP